MTSAEDELDYMSDNFIVEGVKEDIRPGLIKSHSQKRHHEISKKKLKTDEKNKLHNPSHKLIEAEKREDGLKQPIASDNVGFKIMQKLGFLPGSALGKTGTGRTEPVEITLKTDRQGLGRQAALKEVAQMKAKRRSEAVKKLTNIADYRARLTEQATEKRDVIDLKRSQRACRDLDQQNNLEPEEIWFWPEVERKKEVESAGSDDDEENSDLKKYIKDELEEESIETPDTDTGQDFSVREKLEMLTLYLRNTYFYCVWCGTTYEDYADLSGECPGPVRDEH